MGVRVYAARHYRLAGCVYNYGFPRLSSRKIGDDLPALDEDVLDIPVYLVQGVEDIAALDNHCRHQTTSLLTSQIASTGQIMLQVAQDPQTSWSTTFTVPFLTSKRGFASSSLRWPAAR